jgi:hypothetical protein
MTAAERRAARAAAAAAPAVAAIEASQTQAPSTPPAQIATPAAANPRTQVAALAPQTAAVAPVPHASADQEAAAAPAKDTEKAGKAIVAALAPLPPPRPADLLAYADAPMPPSRPGELVHLAALTQQGAADAGTAAPKADAAKTNAPATTESAKADGAKPDTAKPDAIARLALAANLPVVITRGPKDQQGLPAAALGYAATPGASQAAAPRPRTAAASADAPEIVSARLDRSNYSELTSATPTAEEPPASVLGQAFTGLRQAARIVPDALSATSAGYKIAFNAAAGLLDCSRFTKGAATPPSGVSISEVSAGKAN